LHARRRVYNEQKKAQFKLKVATMPNGNDRGKNEPPPGGGPPTTPPEQPAPPVLVTRSLTLKQIRRSLDNFEIRSRMKSWLPTLETDQRNRAIQDLSGAREALKQAADDTLATAEFVGDLATPAGAIAGTAIVAMAVGTLSITPIAIACAGIGGLVFVGGRTYKFIATRLARKDLRRVDACNDIINAK
jgi:hypothetical protein